MQREFKDMTNEELQVIDERARKQISWGWATRTAVILERESRGNPAPAKVRRITAAAGWLRRNWWPAGAAAGFTALSVSVIIGIWQGHSLQRHDQILYVSAVTALLVLRLLQDAR